MTEVQIIEEKIEVLREKMYQCYKENHFNDEVVKISQDLDKLLNIAREMYSNT